MAHCDDSTAGDYVNSLTFTELYSGWTENRAVCIKSAKSVLAQLKKLNAKEWSQFTNHFKPTF